MKAKQYSSYAEIDRELEILKLERKLHLEKLKLSIEDTKENLTPGKLVQGYFGFSTSNMSNSIVTKLVKDVLPFAIKWIMKRI